MMRNQGGGGVIGKSGESSRHGAQRMNEAETPKDGEISVFAILSTIVRNRKQIALWTVAFSVLAAIRAAGKESMYAASASFVSQNAPADRTGLGALAGQFGITVPGNTQTSSPEFYVWLVKSRALLTDIANDTLVVTEMGGKRMSMYDILKVGVAPRAAREQATAEMLGDLIKIELRKTTGVVEVKASTPWPSVSLEIVSQVINGINKFNRDTRRGQAAEERKFTEARLKSAAIELRTAEEDMQRYLSTNRQISPYSELAYRRDQLQRTLMLKQQVYTTLAQSYEDVRMREVRDTPVISIVEVPAVNQQPESRGRAKMVFLGLVIGVTIGVLLTLLAEWLRWLSLQQDADTSEFFDALQQIRAAVLTPFRLRRGTDERKHSQ